MLFLEKKNGSIVCVGNWAQALHFIEQQISTCTVVATSVPSSLSPDQSVLHPVLSLAYQCSKKCPLLVVFKSNQDPNWSFFDLSNLPVGETLQKCPSPQGGNICSAQKLAQEKAWEFALMFCPSYFYVFGGKKEIHVWWHRPWSSSVPWGVHPTPLSCWEQVTGLSFSFPTPCCRKFESRDVTRSLPVGHVGEATQRNRMFWSSLGRSLLFQWLG